MNTQDIEKSVLAEIDRNRDVYIQFLQELIRAPSPNPPGDTRQVAQVITNFLSQHQIEAETIAPQPHMPNLVASFNGGLGPGKRVIYNGHMDTFPASNPDGWKRSLYSGDSDGKQVFGLGGVDMKAGTAASIIAFTLLQRHKESLKGSVALTAVSDEETGGRWGSRYLLEQCGDPSPWKGDVVVDGEPGGLQSVRFGEKGSLRVTFTVTARGANGAYRHISRGANIIASQLIARLLEIESMKPNLPADVVDHLTGAKARAVADEIMGDGAADIVLTPTLNIGVINGGAKVNTIPEKCVFEADFRLPIGLETDVVVTRIQTILADFPSATFEIQKAASNPPNYCDINHPLAQCLQQTAAEVTKREPVMLAGIGGTDCKFWRYHGVPAFVFGVSPKGMGATDEAVSIDEYFTVIKVHTIAVLRYLSADMV